MYMENTELVTYIQTEMQKGVSTEVIREVLVQAGWQIGDIDTAFASAQGGEIKKSRDWNKIWLWGIPGIFISTSLLAFVVGKIGGYYFADFGILFLYGWFPTVGLGLLVIIGYILLGIFKQKMSYIKTAIIMLLIFIVVGGGTCIFNMRGFTL